MAGKFVAFGLALAVAVGATSARADLHKNNITDNTTWNRGSVHYIYGDVHILNGATLTIEAGVEVRFCEVTGTGGYEDGAELVVKDGALVAEGTTALPVKFTSANGVKKMGDWGALVVVGGNQLILKNAVVEYATNGVRLDATTAIGTSRSSFEGTAIRYCLNNGLLASYSRGEFRHLTVENNGYAGIKTIGSCHITVNFSDLCNNGMYNFYNGSSNNQDATNCWWGTTQPSLIGMRIYDYRDNPTKGEVDFDPYLTASWREGGRVPNYSLGFLKSFFK